MTAKQKIQLFIPPIYFKIKRRIKYGIPISFEPLDEKEAIYRYLLELNRRYNYSLTDVEHLTEEMPNGCQSGCLSLNDGSECGYGMLHTLQQYAGILYMNISPHGLSIQHGITYELLAFEKGHAQMTNLVWSTYIAEMLREYSHRDDIFAIGAPFFYAKSILSDEQIAAEKQRLGRNLLAFPMHSTYVSDKKYNPDHFIEVLRQEKKRFDSVRVCLYFRDYNRGFAQVYQDAGFECVSCGHLSDLAFLNRQKALLSVADATISNALGSHVGYSLYMGKPHWLVPDDFRLIEIRTKEAEEEETMVHTSKNYKEIFDAFIDNSDYKITKEQRQIVDKYWGISSVKSPKEMKELLMRVFQ